MLPGLLACGSVWEKKEHYQEEVSFVLAVGDVFHVEGNDIVCMACKNCISCPEDKKADSQISVIRHNKSVCVCERETVCVFVCVFDRW